MKEKRRWWLVPLVVLLVMVFVGVFLRVLRGFHVRMLLDRTWRQEQMVFRVHMELPEQVDGLSFSWDSIGEERYFTIDTGTESVYLHDGALYFSTGTGYDLKGLWEELDIPEELIRNLPFVLPFDRYFDGGYDASVFEVSGEPGFLLKTFFPEAVSYWEQLQSLKIGFYEEAGILRYILIRHDSFYLYAELTGEEPESIPTELLMQMGNKELPDIRTMEPLLRAGQELDKPGTILADVSIHVDCGPLPIQDTGKIRFTEEGLYFSRGDSWTELTSESVKREDLLLGMGWMLLRDSVWVSVGTDSGIFTMTIPSEILKDGILSVIPELDGLELTLNDGALIIQIEHNRFTHMELTCSGELPFLFAQIPLSIRLELSLSE